MTGVGVKMECMEGVRSLASSETLSCGIAGIQRQPELLLTKIQQDEELQAELDVP